jgi:hypothetical protein
MRKVAGTLACIVLSVAMAATATAQTATPAPANENAPEFSADSGCDTPLVAMLIHALGAAPASVTVSASDADAAQIVSLTAEAQPELNLPVPGTLPPPAPPIGLPSPTLPTTRLPRWVRFTSTPGNPATGVLTVRPGIFDYLFAGLGWGSLSAVITATDNGEPSQSATCSIPLRVMLISATV